MMQLRTAALAFASLAATARGQCYLEDANAECAVCWKTTSKDQVTFGECPKGGIEMYWDTVLPEQVIADEPLPVKYIMKVNTQIFNGVVTKDKKNGTWYIPHSNIHSCIMNRGACTPFVSNSPGLATHSPELNGVGSFEGPNNQTLVETFSTELKLPVEKYTIILHGRFFVKENVSHQDPNSDCYPNCLTKYDIATGIVKQVIEGTASPSTDAYVSAGAAGSVVLILLCSTIWAARSGRLNVVQVIQAATRPEITLPCEMIMLGADLIAFTMSFTGEVLEINALVDIIPITALILVFAWIVTIYLSIILMYTVADLIVSKRDRVNYLTKAFATVLVDMQFATSMEEALQDSRAEKYINDSEISKVLEDYVTLKREVKQIHLTVLSLVFADLPLTVIAAYIVKMVGVPEIMVTVALVLSAIAAGGKFVRLGGIGATVEALHVQKMLFNKILVLEETETKLQRSMTLNSNNAWPSFEVDIKNVGATDDATKGVSALDAAATAQ